MPKYKDINGKTYRMVIVRFRNQNDLDKFSEKLGYQAGYLTNYTSEVLVPGGIIKSLDLRRPIYKQTTNYGHFGKENLPWEKIIKLV